jgi:hypothetical protein
MREANDFRKKLDHRLVFQKVEGVSDPGLMLKQEIGVEPGDPIIVAWDPSEAPIEKALFLPKDVPACDAKHGDSRRQGLGEDLRGARKFPAT